MAALKADRSNEYWPHVCMQLVLGAHGTSEPVGAPAKKGKNASSDIKLLGGEAASGLITIMSSSELDLLHLALAESKGTFFASTPSRPTKWSAALRVRLPPLASGEGSPGGARAGRGGASYSKLRRLK